MSDKAEAIEAALREVPIDERIHVFTYSNSESCQKVRLKLASNRLNNVGKEVNLATGEIITNKAADSFKNLKARHGAMVELLKVAEPAPVVVEDNVLDPQQLRN